MELFIPYIVLLPPSGLLFAFIFEAILLSCCSCHIYITLIPCQLHDSSFFTFHFFYYMNHTPHRITIYLPLHHCIILHLMHYDMFNTLIISILYFQCIWCCITFLTSFQKCAYISFWNIAFLISFAHVFEIFLILLII